MSRENDTRRKGAAVLSFGAIPLALWCKWTGVDVPSAPESEPSDRLGQSVLVVSPRAASASFRPTTCATTTAT
jgi:hypothetical protein